MSLQDEQKDKNNLKFFFQTKNTPINLKNKKEKENSLFKKK
jgi:hypothetical protein